MRRVGIIDYGLCNIDSVCRAVEVNGAQAAVVSTPEALAAQDMLILPGVGSFGTAIANLDRAQLVPALRERVAAGTPLLGICLGMQLLASSSEEGGRFAGLGLIPGEVVMLKKSAPDERIPHVGWNVVNYERDDPVFADVPSGTDFYFVHSFHMRCADQADVLARTPFCDGFVSVVRHDNVWGMQFHPEKSLPAGHTLLRNFLAMT
jgi:glutamine amidotransferase